MIHSCHQISNVLAIFDIALTGRHDAVLGDVSRSWDQWRHF